jgi:hypothetical protein
VTFAPANGIENDGLPSPAADPSRTSVGGGSFLWAVGVYAAPRKERTLFQTVASLRAAGWEPTIQAEPGTVVPPAVRAVFNPTRKGVVHNFRALASRLLDENPAANAFLTVQDDALFHPDSRTFIESAPWPAEDAAFVSLYCSRAHSLAADKTELPPGIRQVKAPDVWGDLAMVWPRRVLEEYVASPLLKNWRGTPGDLQNLARRRASLSKGLNPYLRNLVLSGAPVSLRNSPGLTDPYPRGSDVAAGMFAHQTGRSMWVVDPSPVRHIAVQSTIPGHLDNTGNRNALRPADFSRPLREQVFPACQAANNVHTPPIEGA